MTTLREFEGKVVDAVDAILQAQASHRQGLIDAYSALLQVMDEKGITVVTRAEIEQCRDMAGRVA